MVNISMQQKVRWIFLLILSTAFTQPLLKAALPKEKSFQFNDETKEEENEQQEEEEDDYETDDSLEKALTNMRIEESYAAKLFRALDLTLPEQKKSPEEKYPIFKKQAKEIEKLLTFYNNKPDYLVFKQRGYTALHLVLINDNLPCFDVLIKDTRIHTIINVKDSTKGYTPLSIAIIGNSQQKQTTDNDGKKIKNTVYFTQKLLMHGALMDIKDNNEMTPFLIAVYYDRIKQLNTMVTHFFRHRQGLPKKETRKFFTHHTHGMAPLLVASLARSEKVMALLIKYGSCLNLMDARKRSMLHIVIEDHKCLDCVKTIINSVKKDREKKDLEVLLGCVDLKKGDTAIMLAAKLQLPDILTFLLDKAKRIFTEKEYKETLQITNLGRKNALDIAYEVEKKSSNDNQKKNKPSCSKILVEAGAEYSGIKDRFYSLIVPYISKIELE